MSPQPPKVSGRHRDTLRHVFAHPMSHNVEWHDVLSLLREVAEVHEQPNGKVGVVVDGTTTVLPRPRGKEVGAEELVEVRHLLEALGCRPEDG